MLDFVVGKGWLDIPNGDDGLYEKKDFHSAYRNVHRLLQSLGYQRGKQTGNMVPDEIQQQQKAHYIREVVTNLSLSPEEHFRDVYTDESYIHEHYNRVDDSITRIPWRSL